MKSKILTLIVALTCSIHFSFSQVTEGEKKLRTHEADTIVGWKKGAVVTITFSQTSLKNWAAGGENSISINSLMSLFANYKNKNTSWDNSLDVGYGLLRQGKDADFMKTDDKIDFLSKFGKTAFKNFYWAALLNFKTQMTDGFNYPNDSVRISGLFAPAYLLGAVGMDYKPSEKFTAFLAPVTAKMTFVNDQTLADAGAFGVEAAVFDDLGNITTKGKTSRAEFGGYLRIMFKSEIFKNVSLQSKIDLFSNYLNNPQNVDVNWETLIALKVNKLITATITTNLLYDDDVDIQWTDKDGIEHFGPTTQFKEVLGVGISYKF
ncbi:MAG: hypothetical protein A2033_14990 [Bacteroidetes bacterium GWA2_31_9]|nr:MAG: hypothetical protein A2033_14990 [Bacteroidetes bacterium GWA2_31_9]